MDKLCPIIVWNHVWGIVNLFRIIFLRKYWKNYRTFIWIFCWEKGYIWLFQISPQVTDYQWLQSKKYHSKLSKAHLRKPQLDPLLLFLSLNALCRDLFKKVLLNERDEGQDGLMGSTMLLSLQHCCRIIVLHVSDINWSILSKTQDSSCHQAHFTKISFAFYIVYHHIFYVFP